MGTIKKLTKRVNVGIWGWLQQQSLQFDKKAHFANN